MSKRKRNELTLEDKIKLIRESESIPKPTLKALSETYGIGKSTAGDIIKKKENLKAHWERNGSPCKLRLNYDAKYERLNRLVWDWFCVVRAKCMPVSGPLVKEKALQFANELEIEDFKASNGWLDKFKDRHSIKEFKVSGESGSVDEDVVENFKSRIPEVVGEFSLDDVFNCDETGLFFRALPDKTLSARGTSSKGTKLAKDRITILFACSASGEKLKPLVIGKSENPRCFKNVKKSELGVKYTSNKKAWMNQHVFREWLTSLNNDMRRQRRSILLLLDNASSHGKVSDYSFSNVSIKFLPANTTSKLQPLDQGIIRAFKGHYRKNMLRSLLSQMDSVRTVTDLCKSVSILDAVNWTVQAWDSVKVDTVKKCFLSVGFSATYNVISECNDDEEEFEDDDVPLAVLVEQFRYSKDDFENFDGDVPTEDDTDQWESNLLDSYREETTVEEVIEVESEIDCDLTHKDVLAMVIKLKQFALSKDADYLSTVQGLQTMTEKKIVKSKCAQKQLTIDSFFSK